MKYIFENNNIVGKLPIANIQVVFYDVTRDGRVFDESFINPENFNVNDLMYICNEDNNDDMDKSKVFVNLLDGRRYELVLRRI